MQRGRAPCGFYRGDNRGRAPCGFYRGDNEDGEGDALTLSC